MADVHTWVARIRGFCNAKIDPSSRFYAGPFRVGTTAKICDLYIKNAGENADRINIKVSEFVGGMENVLQHLVTDSVVNPGAVVHIPIEVTVPDRPGTWNLGVKVWCTEETEPSW